MGVGWFHSFLLRVLQNLLTKNEEGSHLLCVRVKSRKIICNVFTKIIVLPRIKLIYKTIE